MCPYYGDPKLNHAKPSVATGILGGKRAEGNQVTFNNPGILHPSKQHEIFLSHVLHVWHGYIYLRVALRFVRLCRVDISMLQEHLGVYK